MEMKYLSPWNWFKKRTRRRTQQIPTIEHGEGNAGASE